MGSNPSGRGAEKTRKRLPAQRARREAPQRPPAQQADPLTAHQSMLKRLASASRFFVDFAWGRTRKGAELSNLHRDSLRETRLKPRKRVLLRGIMLAGLDTCCEIVIKLKVSIDLVRSIMGAEAFGSLAHGFDHFLC